ncbi:MAG: helix-turn-helix domain-containing protein, partial [Burkholderiales bacterium]
SSAPLASIALDAGYESEAAFSRAFKRTVGVSPSVWRRERMNGRPQAARSVSETMPLGGRDAIAAC